MALLLAAIEFIILDSRERRLEADIQRQRSQIARETQALDAHVKEQIEDWRPSEYWRPLEGLGNEQFIRLMYVKLLGRVPAPEEVSEKTDALAMGYTRTYVLGQMIDSAEFREKTKGAFDLDAVKR